jgi:thiosulfate/3-mercaptopyruvate sulfurtransferase
MNYTTLISAAELNASMLLIDVGFDLADTAAGERAYLAGHLPGAHYLHLDHDLSGPKTGTNGRHPLPDRAAFAERMRMLGLSRGTQVVAYDAQGGMYAARLWWMLRWIGHAQAAVLDGGKLAWTGALSTEVPVARSGDARLGESLTPMFDADTLQAQLGRVRLIDARAPERFRGEVEPLDAVAGHIPGAANRLFKLNLQEDGRFKPAAQLRAEFAPLLAPHGAAGTVHQCGSGVTACHNLLAMEHAGLGGSALYPGSWSEWSADRARPVAKG